MTNISLLIGLFQSSYCIYKKSHKNYNSSDILIWFEYYCHFNFCDIWIRIRLQIWSWSPHLSPYYTIVLVWALLFLKYIVILPPKMYRMPRWVIHYHYKTYMRNIEWNDNRNTLMSFQWLFIKINRVSSLYMRVR